MAQFHLKRLGIPTYDTFFEEFEDAVGEVVELNNVLNDALLELHVRRPPRRREAVSWVGAMRTGPGTARVLRPGNAVLLIVSIQSSLNLTTSSINELHMSRQATSGCLSPAQFHTGTVTCCTCRTQVACTAAAAPDPNHSLLLEVWTDGVRSTPQLLVDVAYADGSGRPSPWEVRSWRFSTRALAGKLEVHDARRVAPRAMSGTARARPPNSSTV